MSKDQDNLTKFLILINGGVHPKKLPLIQQQKEIIAYLRMRKGETATREQLEELIGCKFSKEKNEKLAKRNRDRFYHVLGPLLKTMIESNRQELEYKLNIYYFDSILDNIRKTLKPYFKEGD